MDRLTAIAGSGAAALALLPLLQNDYARAATVAADDVRLATETASYDAGGVRISGYLTRLKARGKRPAVIVIHENRGLNPHIQDVARRIALEGYLAFAVDMLSPQGGTPADDDKAREMFGTLKLDDTAKQLAAAVPFLAGHAESTGSVGAIGFCWGGGMVNRIAILAPDLKAGVAPLGLEATGDPVFCSFWTLTGMPSLNLPVLADDEGLPIGVQLVGAPGRDERLLRTARALLDRLSDA
jgi:carboxymethylenebutenolidase